VLTRGSHRRRLRSRLIADTFDFSPSWVCLKPPFSGDGEEAMAYLSGDGVSHNRTQFPPLPSVLLLDLDILHKNGFGVLQWLQDQQQEQKRLPI